MEKDELPDELAEDQPARDLHRSLDDQLSANKLGLGAVIPDARGDPLR